METPKSKRPIINKLLTFLLDRCRNEILTHVTVWTWEVACSELTDEQILNGMKRIIKEEKENYGSFPTTAKFIDLCLSECGYETQKAWTELERAVRTKGSTKAIYFADSKITRAVKNMCGWVQLCNNMNEDSKPFLKKEFIKIYESLPDLRENEILEGRYTKAEIEYKKELKISYVGNVQQEEKQFLIESLNGNNALFSSENRLIGK